MHVSFILSEGINKVQILREFHFLNKEAFEEAKERAENGKKVEGAKGDLLPPFPNTY